MTSFCKRAALALIILPLAIACNQPKTSAETTDKAPAAPGAPAAKADTADPHAGHDHAPGEGHGAEPAKPQTVCEKYAAAVCTKIGDQTAECGALKTASKFLTEAACKEANKDIGYAETQFKAARKDCNELVSKLCTDIGPETKTCEMVTTMTAKFPLVAPDFPPLTGASSTWQPFCRNFGSISRINVGRLVERSM